MRKNVSAVLAELFWHPKRFLVDCWNWKAATLSIILRAPIYLIATARHGFQAMIMAGIVEAIFSAVFAGVYASFTEAVEDADPQWAVALLLLVFVPGVALVLDGWVHYFAGTPNLKAGIIASLVVSILASAFNWYSMRRGTLLVGPQRKSFGHDLLRLPILIGKFLLEPFLLLARALNPSTYQPIEAVNAIRKYVDHDNASQQNDRTRSREHSLESTAESAAS